MRLSLNLLSLTGKYAEHFARYGAYAPTPLSLKKLTSFGDVGSPQKSAAFLCDEIPVRLANIMQEIQLLPMQIVETPSVKLVIDWYEQSFRDFIDFIGISWNEVSVKRFNSKLAQIRDRHTTTVETMAHGVMEMQERCETDAITNNRIQYFLDRFYMSRISLRMLLNQHLLIFGSELDKHRRFVGSIDPSCNVLEILDDAYEDAKFLCEHYYTVAPKLNVHTVGDEEGKIEFVYVPSHLYHILFELMKNAMRAIVEHHCDASAVPPIDVLVAAGQENVTLKISDLGGGIPRSQMDLVFNYTYTTARQNQRSRELQQYGNAPLAGYGYGLPLSRLYAKYFNGDLILASVERYGTDAIIYLKRNAAEADEVLPVFNRTSAKQYGAASIPIADWSNPHFNTGWRKH